MKKKFLFLLAVTSIGVTNLMVFPTEALADTEVT